MSINVLSPPQIKIQIAQRARQKRLQLNLSRKTLSLQSGIPISTLKRFETTGDISLDALLCMAMVLDSLSEFAELFQLYPPYLLKQAQSDRQRGRQ